jgi:hypothetical protein
MWNSVLISKTFISISESFEYLGVTYMHDITFKEQSNNNCVPLYTNEI